MKKPMFVVPKHCEGSDATTMTNCGFLLPIIFNSYKITAGAGFLFSVIRNQPDGPSQVLARNFKDSAFSIATYQSGKDYISVNRIKRQNTMRNNKNNGLPTGESNLLSAELRQLIKSYLSDIGGPESLKEDVFQLMESLVASMGTLGLDSSAVLHYFFICRCTVDLVTDLETLLLQSSNSSQSCHN